MNRCERNGGNSGGPDPGISRGRYCEPKRKEVI